MRQSHHQFLHPQTLAFFTEETVPTSDIYNQNNPNEYTAKLALKVP